MRFLMIAAALLAATPSLAQLGVTYTATPTVDCRSLVTIAGTKVKKGVLMQCPADAPKSVLVIAPVVSPPKAAGIQVGMNMSSLAYFSSEGALLDRSKTRDKWQLNDATGWHDYAGAVDTNGYPVGAIPSGASIGGPIGVDDPSLPPPDRYVLTWSGTARIGSILSCTIVTAAANRATCDASYAWITPLWTGGTLTDVHVVREDQEALLAAGQTFNPAFLAKASQWSALRFMDWLNTNNLPAVTWASRPTERSATWASGAPIEVIVKLANQAHADLWYNVPTQADDSYVRNALTVIRNTLDPALKVHVEYTNEPWNFGFPVTRYSTDKATALWGVDANHDGKVDVNDRAETVEAPHMVYYGYRAAQVAKIARDVLGARALPVLGSQTVWADLTTYYTLPGIARAGVGKASDLFAEYAVTTYFGFGHTTAHDRATLLGWARGGEAGLTAAFRELELGGALDDNQSLAAQRGFYAAQGAIAKANGMKLVAYEGGPHLVAVDFPDGPDQDAYAGLLSRMQNDPRMAALYVRSAKDLEAAGGTLATYFNDIGGWSKYGSWGMTDNVYTTSPREQAMKTISR